MTTPTSVSMRDRLRTDYQWTTRQKQVLELIARGRSNTEIAAALGLSLAGAKWHVSEILSKLQADQREEAADYWRRYNGLAPRFERIFRGIAGGLATKWVAGSAAVLVAGAATAVIVAIAINQSSDEPAASITPGTGSPTTPTVTSSAEPSPTVPAQQQGGTLDVNGRTVPLNEAIVLDATDNPGSLSLLVTHGCLGCDVPDIEIERVTWDGAGNVEREIVFSATERGGSYITGLGASDDGSVLVAGVCVRSYCGPIGSDFFEDAQVTLFRSIDGGMTWSELATVDGYAFPLGVSPEGEAIVQRVSSESERYVAALPSDSRYAIQAEIGAGNWPWIVGATPYWKLGDGRILQGPERIWTLDVPEGSNVTGVQYWGRQGLVYQWTALDGQGMFGVPCSDGPLCRAWELPTADFQLAGWSRGQSSRIVANMGVNGGSVPVLLRFGPDPDDLEIQPLKGPMFPDADRNKVVAAVAGPLARVNAGGDCLNVREEASPDAATLACYVDGVLLRDLAQTTEAGGVTWLKVATPDGREGWASTEFLVR